MKENEARGWKGAKLSVEAPLGVTVRVATKRKSGVQKGGKESERVLVIMKATSRAQDMSTTSERENAYELNSVRSSSANLSPDPPPITALAYIFRIKRSKEISCNANTREDHLFVGDEKGKKHQGGRGADQGWPGLVQSDAGSSYYAQGRVLGVMVILGIL